MSCSKSRFICCNLTIIKLSKNTRESDFSNLLDWQWSSLKFSFFFHFIKYDGTSKRFNLNCEKCSFCCTPTNFRFSPLTLCGGSGNTGSSLKQEKVSQSSNSYQYEIRGGWNTKHVRNFNGRDLLFSYGWQNGCHFVLFSNGPSHWEKELLASLFRTHVSNIVIMYIGLFEDILVSLRTKLVQG